jgi:hypothetical protein
VLKDQGNLAGARLCFERALPVVEVILGLEHRSTRTVRENLDSLTSAGEPARDSAGTLARSGPLGAFRRWWDRLRLGPRS